MKHKLKTYLHGLTALIKGKEDEEAVVAESAAPVVSSEDLFHALGVEVIKDDGADQYIIGFQGGYFRFNFSKTHVSIIYPNFSACSHVDTIKAVLVANQLNCKYLGWTCYVSAEDSDTNENPVNVCMSSLINRVGTIDEQADYVRNMLLVAFSVAREYRDELQKAKKDHIPLDDFFNQKEFNHKLAMLKRMAEVGMSSRDEAEKEEKPLTIESIVSCLDATSLGCLTGLQIVVGDKMEVISDLAEIDSFDIRTYVVNHPEREQLNEILLIAHFEQQNLLIHLSKTEGSTEKCYFYLMQVSRSGIVDDLPEWSDDSLSTLTTVAVKLTTDQEDYWEVKYMFDDAKEKRQAGNESELLDEQRVMLDELSPSLRSDAYWSRKFFAKGCMLQALFHFKRIYASILASSRSDEAPGAIELEYAFYLGVAYLQLKNYERAYYYLHKAKDSNKLIAIQYYVLCRNFLKDSSVESYISGLLVSLMEELFTASEPDSALLNFYSFLNRQLIFAMENFKNWNKAEQHLHRMIDRNQDVEFAKKELERIQKMRSESDPESAADHE